jgi:hypothetical protein
VPSRWAHTVALETLVKSPGPFSADYFDRVSGEHYTVTLGRLHKLACPRTYLEVGTATGTTLAIAACSSVAIDPHFDLTTNVLRNKERCFFFQQTSDEFFSHTDPRVLLGGDIDLVFLDGLHLFENLLSDFIHAERACSPHSIIAIHDCVPGDEFISSRSMDPAGRASSRHPDWWAGDVWKLIPVLRALRSELHITVLDAQPTGLVLCTGLEPESTVLAEAYNDLVKAFVPLSLSEYGTKRFFDALEIMPSAALVSHGDVESVLRIQIPFGWQSNSVASATQDQLYRFRDPLSYPRIRADELVAGRQGVWIEPPGTATARLRPYPLFHDFPGGQSMFERPLSEQPPLVIYPPPFILARNDVTLVGYRSLLGSDATFCTDDAFVDTVTREQWLTRLGAPSNPENEDTGLTPDRLGGGFRLHRRDRPERRIEGSVVLLCSAEPANYGSFLFRVLPKLVTMRTAGLQERILVPIYAPSMRELLNMCGVDDGHIIRHDASAIYKIDRGIFLSLRNAQAFLDDATLAFYADLRDRFGLPQSGRRLYITRRGTAGSPRLFQNEDDLIEKLKRYEFEVIEPSSLSAVDQIRTFSSADFIIGQSGSALFNSVFCHAKTRLIDIETEPHWLHAHLCLFGSLKMEFAIFEGDCVVKNPNIVHKPFTANIQALEKRVQALL